MSLRTFIGIKVIPEPRLLKVYDEVRDSLTLDKIKWVPEKNMHITLHFLGETSTAQLPEVKALIKAQLSGRTPFPVRIGGVSFFSRQSKPGALFFQIEHSEELLDTAGRLKIGLQKMGFKTGTAFRPHVTVGRIKHLSDREHFFETMNRLEASCLQSIYVEEVILYRSTLKPDGPVYESLAVFRLQG